MDIYHDVVRYAHAMDRAEHPIERPGGQHSTGRFWVPMRLAELHPTKDLQVLELSPAALDRLVEARDVEYMLAVVDGHPVGVLGEGDARQSDLEGPLAGMIPVAARGIPRPFRVHAEIGRQGALTRLPGMATLTRRGG